MKSAMKRTMATAVATGLLALGAGAGAQSWPEWQGPDRDNKSPDKGLLNEWPEGGPRLLWSRPGIGDQGYSTVAVSDGRIYTTGTPASGQCLVTALDMDGEIQWQAENGPAFVKSYGGARATPTIDDGRLYLLSGVGRLGCFDAKTGAEQWAVDLVKTFGGKLPKWGYAASVLVDGDRVFALAGGTKAGMVAFNKRTGEVIWKTASGLPASYCAPLLVAHGGVRQLVTGTGEDLLGIRTEDGGILWRVPTTNQWKVHATTPVFQDGGLYFTSGYGHGGFRLDLAVDGEQVNVTRKWRDKALDNHHGGVVLADGFIYGYGDRKGWTCLDFAGGEVKWTAKGVGKGSVTFADGMLYCLGERSGELALVRATPERYDQISRFQVPRGGRGPFWAHPVVIGGRLYVRHADVLHCYDVKGE